MWDVEEVNPFAVVGITEPLDFSLEEVTLEFTVESSADYLINEPFDPANLFDGENGFFIDALTSPMYEDAGGSIPITDGRAIGRIDDLSGNGNNFYWFAEPSYKPLLPSMIDMSASCEYSAR